jgi:uncharacterized membrane protein YuzA (DUF378 family)
MGSLDKLFIGKLLFKFAMVVLIVGALAWLSVGIFQINPVEKLLGFRSPAARVVYILVGICAVAIMFNRDTYLPFLGETVLPCAIIPEQLPEGADTQVKVHVTPGAKVLYWAAEPATEGLKNIKDWRGAYLKYMNSGVVKANEEGVATLMVRKPQPYRVPWKGQLEPHIHFRECNTDGMVSRIKTVFLSDGRVEGFENPE